MSSPSQGEGELATGPMTGPSPRTTRPRDESVADYDSNDYDYRTYWDGRDYEQRAEKAVLDRLIATFSPSDWFVDLGAGFGRNALRYRHMADNIVLVDYSANNMVAAAEMHAKDIAAGRLHLVRGDLNKLPFRDAAFDSAVTIRVLHHLTDLEHALVEMMRTVSRQAIIDVPVKTHILNRVRALRAHTGAELKGAAPKRCGDSDHPFWEFDLATVRALLDRIGWDTTVAASVNNFRRWDRMVPKGAVHVLAGPVQGLESVMQRVGRRWWGPNQFLRAERRHRPVLIPAATASGLDAPLAGLAARMQCPNCRGELTWTPDAATCAACGQTYPRIGSFWDFAA